MFSVSLQPSKQLQSFYNKLTSTLQILAIGDPTSERKEVFDAAPLFWPVSHSDSQQPPTTTCQLIAEYTFP